MVEYINYEGKRLPIRIKYFALLNFQKETGKSFDEVQEEIRKSKGKGVVTDMARLFEIMQPLLYYSLISGLKALDKKAELEYDRDDMFDILEECFVEFTEVMPRFFPPVKEEETGADDGKKLLGKRQQKRKEARDQNKDKKQI